MLDLAKIIINPSPLQEINDELFEEKNIKFFLKRDDLLHPLVSGNKWRKSKYNLLKMNELGLDILCTLGGAFSNHIYSTAAAGKIFGFKTIGIIRGDELNENSNSTLRFAAECGMKLIFVSRTDYRNKEKLLETLFSSEDKKRIYFLPEGGTNDFALKGVGEIVDEVIVDLNYARAVDKIYIATAVGTGGTLAGICSNYQENILPIGIAAVSEKEANVTFDNIHNLMKINKIEEFHFNYFTEYNFGGYARISQELINFIKKFEEKHEIMLEQVYTGKLLFGLYNLIMKNYFPENSMIVAVHTGGLQGRNF